jgi:L-2-hydroxyglutarate oxidase LhgO
MTKPNDVIIIGGGIVGLAVAMELSTQYPNYRIRVLEKEDRLAAHQTGHNSGVIHAGLYYRPGSQKASFCVEGAKMVREFCDQHGIAYDLVGKVVVASDESELGRLDSLYERGTANGVEGLVYIDQNRLKELEPHAVGVKGLHSPKTGIVDYKQVSAAYGKVAQENGVEITTGVKVLKVSRFGEGMELDTTAGQFETTRVINCAGLYCDEIARMMGVHLDMRIIPFRGEYYSIRREKHHLVNSLIYPVPNPEFPFLGVHFTRMIGGGVEAGPNAVLAFAKEGYRMGQVNLGEFAGTLGFGGFWAMARKYWKTGLEEFYRSMNKKAFTRALQKLVPEIQEEDLSPGGAGVRAQAVDKNGALVDDFAIVAQGNALHVLNAPSPAATASLAIARHVVSLAAESFGLEERRMVVGV